MEKRKNDEKDLRKFSGLFFQIGLLAALMLAICAFEFRTLRVVKPVNIEPYNYVEQLLIPVTSHDAPTKPPKPPKRVLLNPVESAEPDLKADPVIEELFTEEIEPLIQLDPPPIEIAQEYHDYVDQMPTPAGGYAAFYKFISKNIRYPSRARNLNIEGKVYVQFVVDEHGKIREVKVVKGAGAGLDEEAERVVAISPDWVPGKQGGRRVKVRMIMPITFKLAGPE